MHSYDVEATNGLGELAEDSDEEDDSGSGQKRTSFEDANGRRTTTTMNGEGGSGGYGPPRRARTIESERVSAAGQKSFDQFRR